jgi:positive regulator of sigma E activity
MIIAEGRVRSVRPGSLVVRRANADRAWPGCEDCLEPGACALLALALSGRRASREVICAPRGPEALQVGDAAEICLSPRRALAAAVATYGVLLGWLAGGVAMASSLAGTHADALTASGCLMGLAFGVLTIRLIDRRYAHRCLPVARRPGPFPDRPSRPV